MNLGPVGQLRLARHASESPEGVGTVVETASGSRFKPGDRVIVFQGNSCQECFVCTQGLSPTHCLGIPYEGFDDVMAPQDVTAGLLGIEKVNNSESGGFAMARYRLAPEHMVTLLADDASFENTRRPGTAHWGRRSPWRPRSGLRPVMW